MPATMSGSSSWTSAGMARPPASPSARFVSARCACRALVALFGGEPVGYISLMLDFAPLTTWATDLVVHRPLRKQGIGTALVLAAMEWAENMDTFNLILEMQPKNYPALSLALKLGFELCGYNDRYYSHHEIGLFFGKVIR
jgi:GNAT superfamily N-acetyltransferase